MVLTPDFALIRFFSLFQFRSRAARPAASRPAHVRPVRPNEQNEKGHECHNFVFYFHYSGDDLIYLQEHLAKFWLQAGQN